MHFRTITWREKNIATNKMSKAITQGHQGHQYFQEKCDNCGEKTQKYRKALLCGIM